MHFDEWIVSTGRAKRVTQAVDGSEIPKMNSSVSPFLPLKSRRHDPVPHHPEPGNSRAFFARKNGQTDSRILRAYFAP
jgi:hypothetical protein